MAAALGASVVFPACAQAQSAGTWNKRGQAAELKQDYDTAYEDYLRAQQKSPKDLRYQTRVDRMRFQAAAQHVDRGRVLRQNGDLAGALNEFTRALAIDPGNEAAAQEIQITQNLDRKASTSPIAPGSAEASVQRDLATIAGPIELKPVSDEPITLHMQSDPKNLYTAIGKLAGLNVLFDSDFHAPQVSLDLDRVSLADALRILGIEANAFYKPLTPDTIFVAPNNHQKHLDLDDQTLQTFYLTNPTQQTDANEIYTALRQILPPEVKSFFVPTQNAITMRGSSDDLALAQKLLYDLDRPRAEVVVDIAILEVNRDKVRNLGISLPQSVTVTPQATPGTTTTSSSSSTSTNGTPTNTPSNFTVNTLANLKANNLQVNITGATANALLTDSDTRVLQNPSMRATDGQQATLKIGSRIPIATGSLSTGAVGGITGGLGVQTSFSFVDIGVNIDMKPTIHLNRDVSLALSVEVSNHASDVAISPGITQPVIGQRSTKTTIELKDGEPCLLAGIITKTDTANLSGTPGLSQIPVLKYMFGSNFKENAQDEVVFLLIPHIVREAVLTRQNVRQIDTGTTNDIQIRRVNSPIDQLFPDSAALAPEPPSSPTTAANAATAMAQQLNRQAQPPSPPGGRAAAPATAPPVAPAPAGNSLAAANVPPRPQAVNGPPVSLVVVPPNSNQTVGSTFVTSIVLTNAQDLASVPVEVQYDPKVLQLVNVEAGGLLSKDGEPVALSHRDLSPGTVTISVSRPPGAAGVSGEGQVCLMTFKAIGRGDSNLALVKVGAMTTQRGNVPAVGTQATVHVK